MKKEWKPKNEPVNVEITLPYLKLNASDKLLNTLREGLSDDANKEDYKYVYLTVPACDAIVNGDIKAGLDQYSKLARNIIYPDRTEAVMQTAYLLAALYGSNIAMKLSKLIGKDLKGASIDKHPNLFDKIFADVVKDDSTWILSDANRIEEIAYLHTSTDVAPNNEIQQTELIKMTDRIQVILTIDISKMIVDSNDTASVALTFWLADEDLEMSKGVEKVVLASPQWETDEA